MDTPPPLTPLPRYFYFYWKSRNTLSNFTFIM
jgi:hypothetical protein